MTSDDALAALRDEVLVQRRTEARIAALVRKLDSDRAHVADGHASIRGLLRAEFRASEGDITHTLRCGRLIEDLGLKFVFQKIGIILCQFLDSASFGIRAVKLAFDGVDPRLEHVAMTLGCGRAGAFFHVALPLARRGIVVGGILIWTRAFGIFGPLMVFVGAVRMRTEVLPTTIYLEQSVGRIEVALAVALLMIALATVALVTIRLVGLERQ